MLLPARCGLRMLSAMRRLRLVGRGPCRLGLRNHGRSSWRPRDSAVHAQPTWFDQDIHVQVRFLPNVTDGIVPGCVGFRTPQAS